MDPSRILLLVAVGVFAVWLLVKMLPVPDEDVDGDGEPLEPLNRRERRLYRRLRKLPPESLERLAARIDRLLERGTDGADPDEDDDAADSLAGDSMAEDSLSGEAD